MKLLLGIILVIITTLLLIGFISLIYISVKMAINLIELNKLDKK